jgi:hypothetical protein
MNFAEIKHLFKTDNSYGRGYQVCQLKNLPEGIDLLDWTQHVNTGKTGTQTRWVKNIGGEVFCVAGEFVSHKSLLHLAPKIGSGTSASDGMDYLQSKDK